jgi:hypothetical protein
MTVLLVGLIGLGIGGTTAAATLLDRVLLRSLPVSRPDELVMLGGLGPNDDSLYTFPEAFFRRARAASRTLSDLIAYRNTTLTVRTSAVPRAVRGVLVSDNLFEALGIRPVLGRIPTGANASQRHPPYALLSHGYWTRDFGGDSAVIGRVLSVNGASAVVSAVLPQTFSGMSAGQAPQDIWLPLTAVSTTNNCSRLSAS